MSVASEITRLQNAKASLKTSINAKTNINNQITNETIDEYADFVDSITTGAVILPDGYTPVNYIKSSGTQYINTGYIPNINTKINIKCLHGTATSASGAVFGCRTESTIDRYMLAGNSKKQAFFWGDVEPDNPHIQSNISTGSFVDVTIENSKATFNEEEYTNFSIDTYPNFPIYLFCTNTGGTATAFSTSTIGRFKIYENNILIHDFIPCMRNNDSVVGMYDVIDNQFFTYIGTNPFSYGALYNY